MGAWWKMKDYKIKNKITTILIALMMLTAISSVGFCQGSVALLVQQTPPQGGNVSPGVGVHDIAKNSVVTLTATPKPGYQFAYWLGDVADAVSATTIASLESPKMIIAVFERNDFALEAYEPGPTSAPNENLRRGDQDLVAQSNSPVAGKRSHSNGGPSYDEPEDPEDPEDNDFPVPDEGDDVNDFPVPEVPEPMTIILLGLGSAFVSTRKRKK